MKKRIRTDKTRLQDRLRQKKARLKTRALVRSYKTECSYCSEKHPACLQFHHVDPATKVMSIQQAVARSMPHDKLIAEIKKCIVLCANCHSKLHYPKGTGLPPA